MEIKKKFHVEKEKKNLSLEIEKLKDKTKNIRQMRIFLQNCTNPETEIFAFCVITFKPIKI